MTTDRHGLPREPYIDATPRGYRFRPPSSLKLARREFQLGALHKTLEEALQAAVAFRNKTIPKTLLYATLRSKRDTSAPLAFSAPASRPWKTGVRFESASAGGEGVWVAQCDDRHGHTELTRYRVDYHGKDMAMRYAVRRRLSLERLHYGHASELSEDDWIEVLSFVQEQANPDIPSWGALKHPGTISEPAGNSFQARITIDQQLHCKSFPVAQYGWRNEARLAAVLWLVKTKAAARAGGHHNLAGAVSGRNQHSDIAGVYRTTKTDRLGRLMVHWCANTQLDGKRRALEFCAGEQEHITDEAEDCARAAAISARSQWEQHVRTGETFDRVHFRDWKRWTGYPLSTSGIPTDIDGVFYAAETSGKHTLRVPYVWEGRERCFILVIGKGRAATFARAHVAKAVAQQFVRDYQIFCNDDSAPFDPAAWKAWQTWGDWLEAIKKEKAPARPRKPVTRKKTSTAPPTKRPAPVATLGPPIFAAKLSGNTASEAMVGAHIVVSYDPAGSVPTGAVTLQADKIVKGMLLYQKSAPAGMRIQAALPSGKRASNKGVYSQAACHLKPGNTITIVPTNLAIASTADGQGNRVIIEAVHKDKVRCQVRLMPGFAAYLNGEAILVSAWRRQTPKALRVADQVIDAAAQRVDTNAKMFDYALAPGERIELAALSSKTNVLACAYDALSVWVLEQTKGHATLRVRYPSSMALLKPPQAISQKAVGRLLKVGGQGLRLEPIDHESARVAGMQLRKANITIGLQEIEGQTARVLVSAPKGLITVPT